MLVFTVELFKKIALPRGGVCHLCETGYIQERESQAAVGKVKADKV